MNRFWNGPTEIRGTLYWDFVYLMRSIKEGIALARKTHGNGIASMGIDTWGVDFGLFDVDGRLLCNPVHYRDVRTTGLLEKVFERVPKASVFAQTGIQCMELNTLYQLMSLLLEDTSQYRQACKLLFSPDLLSYWLTGNMVAERSIASTSQLYNPTTGTWAADLLEQLCIRTDLFADLVDSGTVIGETDSLPVVAVGGHDTASAFAAVPVRTDEESAILSSGTWSLLGCELDAPLINEHSLAANFTNEVGVCGTIRFLKNLSGLWILQELRRGWNAQRCGYTWQDMENMAREAEPFQFFINPSDAAFFSPGDMPKHICACCQRTGQEKPETHAQIIRVVYEGLALLYASTLGLLEELTGHSFSTLRIIGGGCKDNLLNQMAAGATDRTVITGPVEATSTGNLLMQMLAMGNISSLAEGRAIVRNSFAGETQTFEPQDRTGWQNALERWRSVCG